MSLTAGFTTSQGVDQHINKSSLIDLRPHNRADPHATRAMASPSTDPAAAATAPDREMHALSLTLVTSASPAPAPHSATSIASPPSPTARRSALRKTPSRRQRIAHNSKSSSASASPSVILTTTVCKHDAPSWMANAAPDPHTGESSADENTAIIASEHNGSSADRAGYGAAADSQTQAQVLEARPGVRRRKKRRSPSGAEGDTEEEGGWWSRLVERYGSVELENKGSVARDHLALERTFLAWLRTSLSFASIGIAITQLFRLNTSLANPNPSAPGLPLRSVGKPLGATFVGISIMVLFIGFHRYFESQHYVIRGVFPAARGSIALVAAVAGALIVASLVVIVVVAPHAFET